MFQNIVSYSHFNFWKWNDMDILSVLSWISKTVSLRLEVWEIFYIDFIQEDIMNVFLNLLHHLLISSTRLIEFRSTQGGFRRINTTRFKPAPRNSKRTLGYQDLTNTDRNKLKKSFFTGFLQEIYWKNLSETTKDYFIVCNSRPTPTYWTKI